MKKVFITGGTGTVGSSFIKNYYGEYKFYSYSRNEKLQVALKRRFPDIEIILGGIEDAYALTMAITSVKPDIVIHTAALKHVDTAEKQPTHAVSTNIIGSYNVVKACQKADVPITIGISTDKACLPYCVYGYTKLIMEKIFLESNTTRNKFTCCRFGNVAGSHGSVIPFWLSLKSNNQSLKLTDERMSRLMFSQNEAAMLVKKCIDDSKDKGGFILSKNMKKVNMYKLAKIISNNVEVVGIRPGEKLDEDLISEEEVPYTKIQGDYIILSDTINEDVATEEMTNMIKEVEMILNETKIRGKQY
jgi:UDP-N-acetylglucosamine 4,6-dehydratase